MGFWVCKGGCDGFHKRGLRCWVRRSRSAVSRFEVADRETAKRLGWSTAAGDSVSPAPLLLCSPAPTALPLQLCHVAAPPPRGVTISRASRHLVAIRGIH